MLLSAQKGLCFATRLDNLHTIAKPRFTFICILPATSLNLWGFLCHEAIARQKWAEILHNSAQVSCHLARACSIYIANVFIAEE